MTMKKDGIQTRNRKLSAKSKKKRSGSVVDFFSPFGDANKSYYSSMGGYMSQYYGAQTGHHQFGAAAAMYAAPGTGLAGLQAAAASNSMAAAVAASSSTSAAASPLLSSTSVASFGQPIVMS